MEIDKRVMDLLKANAMTFGWDINQMICSAMQEQLGGGCLGIAEDVAVGQWATLESEIKMELED